MNLPGFVTPNFITVTRLLLVPCGVYTLFKNGGDDSTWQIISWFIFFSLGLSDILDGNLARSRNSITEFGKFLDPVADKVMIGAAMISLSILGRMPWWITIVIMGREVGITLLRLAIIRRGVIAANKGGKSKRPSRTLVSVSMFYLANLALLVPRWIYGNCNSSNYRYWCLLCKISIW